MAKLSKRRRPLRLEVGFEVRRGNRDVLERAYERLLPLRTCFLPSSALTPTSEGACDENSAPESRLGLTDPAGRGWNKNCSSCAVPSLAKARRPSG